MAEKEVKLMKGNEVIAHAAIRYGCDGYFGYPITPQSEVMETLMELKPWETTGMVVLQAESEISSINMVYGGASTGKRVMTSSSSPGISLMSEGLSYLAGAELPCLIINCQRGGPGLGTIQPSQGDYFQACKGGGHGDFHLIVLAPNSVQEMHDHVAVAFDLAFKYRNPALILADGAIGQMMEKVVLAPQRPRKTDEEIAAECKSWATYGKPADRQRNIVTSLELQSEKMEIINKAFRRNTRPSKRTRCATKRSTATMPITSSWRSARRPASARPRSRWRAPKDSRSACCVRSPSILSPRSRLPNWPRAA